MRRSMITLRCSVLLVFARTAATRSSNECAPYARCPTLSSIKLLKLDDRAAVAYWMNAAIRTRRLQSGEGNNGDAVAQTSG